VDGRTVRGQQPRDQRELHHPAGGVDRQRYREPPDRPAPARGRFRRHDNLRVPGQQVIGHQPAAGSSGSGWCPPSPDGAVGSAGPDASWATAPSARAESRRHAASAARCSASFLLRPSTPPYRWPVTTAHAVNVFAWSGPASSMRYSGTPSPRPAVNSWRLVFQSSAAPRPAASAMSGSNSLWITVVAVSRPYWR